MFDGCADRCLRCSIMNVNYYKHLFLNKTHSDVTFVVGEVEIPAHRFILSERCEYFKTMFSSDFIEANSDRIIMKETNLKAFECVLQYIYTGDVDHLLDNILPLNDIFDTLDYARFYMIDDLVVKMIKYMKSRGSSNPYLLLNMVLAYSVDALIPYAYDLVKVNFKLPNDEMFKQLSHQSLDCCLKQKTNAPESVIFKALVCWMRLNSQCSSLFPKLLNHIDLHLLGEEHLEILFNPTELIDRNVVQSMLNQQQKQNIMFGLT